MDGAVHPVPEAETNGWGGRQTAVLSFQASRRTAVCTKKPKEGSGKREGSTNKKQHLMDAKADALGKCLQGKAGLGPELQLSASAAKALVHRKVQSSLSTGTRDIHQTASSQACKQTSIAIYKSETSDKGVYTPFLIKVDYGFSPCPSLSLLTKRLFSSPDFQGKSKLVRVTPAVPHRPRQEPRQFASVWYYHWFIQYLLNVYNIPDPKKRRQVMLWALPQGAPSLVGVANKPTSLLKDPLTCAPVRTWIKAHRQCWS